MASAPYLYLSVFFLWELMWIFLRSAGSSIQLMEWTGMHFNSHSILTKHPVSVQAYNKEVSKIFHPSYRVHVPSCLRGFIEPVFSVLSYGIGGLSREHFTGTSHSYPCLHRYTLRYPLVFSSPSQLCFPWSLFSLGLRIQQVCVIYSQKQQVMQSEIFFRCCKLMRRLLHRLNKLKRKKRCWAVINHAHTLGGNHKRFKDDSIISGCRH